MVAGAKGVRAPVTGLRLYWLIDVLLYATYANNPSEDMTVCVTAAGVVLLPAAFGNIGEFQEVILCLRFLNRESRGGCP